MPYNYTQFDVEDRFDGKLKIAYLNDPDTYNALNRMVLKELREFMEKCDDDPNVRCIAVSGRGQAFSSGQNIKSALELAEQTAETPIIKKIVQDYYNPMVLSIVKNKKPVIALVNGPAVGAGAMLAFICDFAVASEKAYFAQAFSNIGLIPDTAGTYYLPKFLGRQTASYLAFTGKKISADEAKQLGMVAEIYKAEEFEAKAFELLEEISNRPTKALGLTKRAFLHSYDNSLVEQLNIEAVFQQKASEGHDFAEGVAAFLEKRAPKYNGQ
ncbi:MAG: enoyl-CoA hydratase-related protein [Bergeyella sp.]